MIVDVINPKTGMVWHVDVPIQPVVFEAGKRDLALSQFISEATRPYVPAGFVLLGNLKTP